MRIGILGCARIAEAALVAPALHIDGVEAAAIASRSLEKAKSFAAAHQIARAFGDYQSLLDDETIEAIYIPLPNSLHRQWTIRALNAGKAVLCEKPLASNACEAEELERAAAFSGRVLMEAFHYRYHPMMLFIEAILREGRLGAIAQVQSRLNIPGRLVPGDDIRFAFDLAGGAMMDVGAYCANAVRFVVGEEPIVRAASADMAAPQIDGAMSAELEFASGARGSIACSLKAEHMASELVILGARGRLRAINPFLPHMGNRLHIEIDGVRSECVFKEKTSYVFQARAFAAAVRGDANALVTGAADAVHNMRLIDAIYRKAGLAPRGGPPLA
jgi:predicted dehydrogenase